MKEDTWVSLQTTILNTCVQFISRLDSNVDQSLTPLSDILFQTLYFIWIKSEITTKEMWGELQSKLSNLTHRKPVVSMWKEKIIQLTYILKDFIYNVNEADLLGLTPKKVNRVTTTTPRDAKLDAINWNQDRILEIWFIMLGIFIASSSSSLFFLL
jgi:hypothetical protein